MHKLIPILLLFLFIQGCQSKEEKEEAKKQAAYVDFEKFKKGRPCGEVKFMCLPESQDKTWQRGPTKDHIEDFELTPEVLRKRQEIVQRWRDAEDGKVKEQSMQLSQLSEAFYDRVEAKKFLSEMEESLEKEFPGFWRGVPIKVRYRWIRLAMNKAKRFGDDSKQNNVMVELCARIGLNFDKDPKWRVVTEFIAKDPKNHLSVTVHYIDWTVFGKTYSRTGVKITDWAMRRAHPGLPWPKKPYPRLND
jgi:hypothetical protein